MRRLWLFAVLVNVACVPFAFVVPPIEASAGIGARGDASQVRLQGDFQVGVRPLSLVPSLHERRNDFAVGYAVVVLPLLHGPSAEVTHVFLGRSDGDSLWRLSGGFIARLLYEPPTARFGAQALLHAVFEFSKFGESELESSDGKGVVVGHAVGELGIGLFIDGGVMVLPSGMSWVLTSGLRFTLPASAGVGFVWAS